MSKKNKKVICYARESTRQQAEEGYNLDAQKKRMEAYVRGCFYDDVEIEIFEDAGFSARSLNRPKMEEIIERIQARKVDGLCVFCIDRLSRSVKDLANLVDLLQKYDVTLLSVQEKIDTSSPQGKFVLHLLGAVAQLESDNISERVNRALLEAAEQGTFAKSRIPFGYMRNPKTKKLEIIEDKAEIIRWIFHEIGYNKRSASSIAKELRIQKPYGKQWYDKRIYDIIRSKIYYGTYEVQGKTIPNHTIPIVTKQEWEDANYALNNYFYGNNKKEYTYKRIVYCTRCKRIMKCVCAYGKNGKIYYYYECNDCNKRISQIDLHKQISKKLNNKIKKDTYKTKVEEIFKGVSKDMKKKYSFEELMNNSNIDYILSIDRVAGRISKEVFEKVIGLIYELQNVDYLSYTQEEKEDIVKKYIEKIFIDEKKHIERIVYKKQQK